MSQRPREASGEDSQSETQDPGLEYDTKDEIEITSTQKAIAEKAQSLYEDSCLFENPFPSPHEDVLTKVDA